MPADHHHRAEARVPRPRRQERARSNVSGVTVADLVVRIRDERYPAEAHPVEVHPVEVHPAEVHPAEVHPAVVHGSGSSWDWQPDIDSIMNVGPNTDLDLDLDLDLDQPTMRIGHRADRSRVHLGPWIAGALASATVLSTSLVISQLSGPDTPSGTSAGTDPAVSDAGNHTGYAPGGVQAGPRIPGPRPASPAADAPGSTSQSSSGDSSPDDALADGAAPAPRGSSDRGPGAHRAPDDRNVDAGPGDGPRRGGSGRGGSTSCDTPGHILNLSNWKLTLPTGSGSSPTEIVGAALHTLTGQNWFSVGRGCGVSFRAPVNGVTTSGSKNPRSELREMTGGGTENAGWSSTSGTHTMVLREAFTKLPSGKPQVVGGQIHDASDDIAVFRLEGSSLYVTNGDDPHYKLVTSNYVLGTPFEAKFVVSGGVVRAFYNGRLVATISKAFSGAYFKAGAYTQANCQNASPCTSGNYGEVTVYSLRVTHA